MLNGPTSIQGVPLKPQYEGHHRENNMPKGVGLIPLGDRNRAVFEYGVAVLEERDSVDQYSKYH